MLQPLAMLDVVKYAGMIYHVLEKWLAKNCSVIILMVEFGWKFTLLCSCTSCLLKIVYLCLNKKRKLKKEKKKRKEKKEIFFLKREYNC